MQSDQEQQTHLRLFLRQQFSNPQDLRLPLHQQHPREKAWGILIRLTAHAAPQQGIAPEHREQPDGLLLLQLRTHRRSPAQVQILLVGTRRPILTLFRSPIGPLVEHRKQLPIQVRLVQMREIMPARIAPAHSLPPISRLLPDPFSPSPLTPAGQQAVIVLLITASKHLRMGMLLILTQIVAQLRMKQSIRLLGVHGHQPTQPIQRLTDALFVDAGQELAELAGDKGLPRHEQDSQDGLEDLAPLQNRPLQSPNRNREDICRILRYMPDDLLRSKRPGFAQLSGRQVQVERFLLQSLVQLLHHPGVERHPSVSEKQFKVGPTQRRQAVLDLG
ncbi:MAG TPA: hypothetical protein VGF67_00515 [Ktedonobacteraceae bacterium]